MFKYFFNLKLTNGLLQSHLVFIDDVDDVTSLFDLALNRSHL